MRSNQVVRYLTIFSVAVASGCAGTVALADSEASFQAGSQSSTQTSSENAHVGSSQANRESTNQGGTGSMSNAINQSSTEAQDEAGRPAVLQPSATGAQVTNAKQPAGSNKSGGSYTSNVRPTSAGRNSATASVTPHEKTTTYHWGRGHSRSRVSSRTHTNKSYMVNTIHQAASTR